MDFRRQALTAPTNSAPDAPHAATPHSCGNCGAVLHGAYCAQCGQHAHASARNLGAVVHDAWHDITHVDGRLWATLWLLLVRPGRLTLDYFAERRARYLPPVRLYLIVSVVFFALTIGGSGERPVVAVRSGSPVVPQSPDGRADAVVEAGSAPAVPSTGTHPSTQPGKAVRRSSLGEEITQANCGTLQSDLSPVLERALRHGCERLQQQGVAGFEAAVRHNIPRMMFVFLPLVAAAMKLLYWRPRRYYVEHLVFLLHNHSALFMWFCLVRLGDLVLSRSAPLHDIGELASLVYVTWYPYRAMRCYYGESKLRTLAKYSMLSLVYAIFLGVTFIGAALFAAFAG